MIKGRSICLALGFAFIAIGCGGDGSSINSNAINNPNAGSNTVNNGPSSGDLGLFVTDNISDKYDHVWVSIKKVELKLAAGGLRTIFEDPSGVGIDLASLHDESGPKYKFVNQLTLPAGTYVGAQITLATQASLFPLKATTSKSFVFDKQAEGAKDAVLAVQFDPPKMLGTGHDDLVLDFDLSKWSDANGKLTAVVTPSLGAGLEDADRNAPVVQEGTVDDLKGDVPAQTFSLKTEKSAAIAVQTSTRTALVSESGATPVVLTKGQRVEIAGSFDTNTRRFGATSIRLKDAKAPESAQVYGVVSSIDPKAGTWELKPTETRGLLPSAVNVPVSAAAGAKYFSASGLELSSDNFIKALSDSKEVHLLVEGSFDAAKGKFTTTEARLQDAEAQPQVEVAGVVADPQSAGQTFGLTVTGFQGLMTRPGAGATVSLSPTTTFVGDDGKALTSEQFFQALSTPKAADVDGLLDTSSGNVVATSIKLSAAPVVPVKGARKAAKVAAVTPKK
jgi:hypothetical protein